MRRPSAGVASLERLEALLANDELFALAAAVPDTDLSRGGRPRTYPAYMWILFDALLSVYGSARAVEAELSHPIIWNHLRALVEQRFPDDPSQHLPATPMRRHHYLYGRTQWLTRPDVLANLRRIHSECATGDAARLGLLDPDGPGSWTHPDLSRMIYADGKVITPLFRAHPGDQRLNKETGELTPARAEPDAGLHFEGTGETAWGTKWVIVAVRSEDVHGRIILDTDWVPTPGGEAATAMDCFRSLTPRIPGAMGVIYDTALRGVHHQTLLRELGLLPLNRVTAAKAGDNKPRRAEGQRVEKSTHLDNIDVTLPDGRTQTVSILAKGGAIGTGMLSATGEQIFTPLRRIRTHRKTDKASFRWYNDYALPADLGGGTYTVRLHANDDDVKRKFNRTENVRPIPPGDPDFQRLYRRRNDAESINRALDDTLFLRRAHSIGHQRQHLNLITYALCVNSLAVHRHGQPSSAPPGRLAA